MFRIAKILAHLFLFGLFAASISFAGSITNVSLDLTDNEAGTNVNFELDFEIESPLPHDGKIKIFLEDAAGQDVSAAAAQFQGMPGTGGFITEWAANNVLVFKRDATADTIPGGSHISVLFGPIRLPDAAGTYLMERLETRGVGISTIDFIENCASYTTIFKPIAYIQDVSPNPGLVDGNIRVTAFSTPDHYHGGQVRIDWGDGNITPYRTGSSNYFDYQYSAAGTYQVRAQAQDITTAIVGNWTDPVAVTILPNTAPITQILNVTPNPVDMNQSFSINVQAIDNENQDVKITIDWGDGSQPTESGYKASGNTFSCSYQYSLDGTYKIKTKARDGLLEGTWSDSVLVKVNKPNTPPRVAILDVIPSSAAVGEEVTVTAWAVDDDDDRVQMRISWSENELSEYTPLEPNRVIFTFKHVYSAAGLYDISVVAKDEHDLRGEWSAKVYMRVTDNPPLIMNIHDLEFWNTQPYILDLDSCLIGHGYPPESFNWQITPKDSNLKADIQHHLAIFYAPGWSGISPVQFQVSHPNGMRDSVTVNATVKAAEPNDNYRIASYDLSTFNGPNDQIRIPRFQMILAAINPDILVVQEMVSEAAINSFLNDVLEAMAPGEFAAAPFQNGNDADNALFYRKLKFEVAAHRQIPTNNREIDEYILRCRSGAGLPEIRIYAAHFQSGTDAITARARLAEAKILRQELDKLPVNATYFICGNLNVLDGVEAAFQKLCTTETDSATQCHDPLNQIGVWHQNRDFAPYHTSSTRTLISTQDTTGGLADRFDFILISAALFDSADFGYVASSYRTFGNDGRHFKQAVNNPVNWCVSPPLADALNEASAHLPVYLDFSRNFVNKPPQIVSADSAIAYEDSVFTYVARAIDPEGSELAYTFRNYPSWLTPADSIISGTPDKSASDTSFSVIAYDGDLTDTLQVELFVVHKNKPPRITSPKSVTAVIDSFFQYTAKAVDPEQQPLSYAFKNIPQWLSVAGAVISGTVPQNATDTGFMLYASDGELSDSLKVRLKVVSHNNPPQITSPDSAVAYEDTPFSYAVTAADPENTRLNYSFRNFPAWMLPGDSTIAGTPTEGATDTSFMVIATDGNLSDSLIVFVKVIAVNDPPVISEIKGVTMDHDETGVINLMGKVSDPDNSVDALTWEVTSLNTNLQAQLNQRLVLLKVTGWVDSVQVKLKVSDPAGAADSTTVTVKVNFPADVTIENEALPTEFSLGQNYPNPFNPKTRIRYALPKEADVRIAVFDLQGRLITELWHARQKAGYHIIQWDASALSSGMYFIQMRTSKFLQTRKCVLLK